MSSLSSIISYGLSSVNAGAQNPGVSTLSSIISYGLSSVQTINITCNITNTQVGGTQCNITNNYINSNSTGISSLSSIVSYGLSTVYSPYGISSLSSIVSYGLSSLGLGGSTGISSLSSIVSYGLSSLGLGGGDGISSLSSIVSYGLSSLGAGGSTGISSLSSIVSYGLSSLGGAAGTGVSSLSSIVSYGLSSFSLNSIPFKSIIYTSGTNINFTNGQINPSVNTVYGFSVYSCAYGNNVWVIGGAINSTNSLGLMYSLNGINWNNCIPIFNTGTYVTTFINDVKYIESNFVAISRTASTSYIVWSSNGINWNLNQTGFSAQVFDYAYNNINNIWKFVLNSTSSVPTTSIKIASNIFATTMTTPTNIVSGGFTTGGRAITYNSNIWVAVGINSNGFSNVQYSINGTNWSNASNVTYKSSSNILRTTAGFGATSVVYVAPNWYVAGAGGTSNNPIYRSSNGINYTAIATSNTSNINIVLSLIYDSNSSQFYSLANIDNLSGYTGNYLISSANNCSNWSVISPFTYSDAKQIGLAAGVITPPIQTTAVFASNIYANTVNTEYITGNGSGLVNVNLGAFSLYIPEGANNVDNTTKTTTNNLSPGLLLSNIFSNSQLIYPGKYLVNIKFYLDTDSGNWSNALPYIYISHFNESLEANTYGNYGYLSRKAIYPINTAFKWHTLTDTIVTTTNTSPLNQYNLYYTDQNTPGAYSMNLYFTDIIVVRIA